MMPWLSAPAVHLLQDTIRLFVTNLLQWELPVAQDGLSAQNKSALPLQIPSSESIPHWPSHLFPPQGDFVNQMKSKLKSTFNAYLSEDEKKQFTTVSRKSIKLHSKSHLIRQEQNSKSQLLQCSTSLFSLTYSYEQTNKAVVNTTALLLGIPMPHPLFLKSQGG